MRALLIMGPTASGKSALALDVAKRTGGEVINADSMQVYADLRVITARPSPEEEVSAPHHLYGVIDAAERYSVGRWLKAAQALIAEIRSRGRTPILIGGTGLYFKALTEGLAPAPAATPELRARLQGEWDAGGGTAMHARLAEMDPAAAARIRPADASRLMRALEVAESGEKLSELQKRNSPPLEDWAGLALTPERARLYEAIDLRFMAMLAADALDEAERLAARGLDTSLPAMKAHGIPWLIQHMRGEMDLVKASALAQRDTRHYAKRQFTWINNQLGAWSKISDTNPDARLKAALGLLSGQNSPELGH